MHYVLRVFIILFIYLFIYFIYLFIYSRAIAFLHVHCIHHVPLDHRCPSWLQEIYQTALSTERRQWALHQLWQTHAMTTGALVNDAYLTINEAGEPTFKQAVPARHLSFFLSLVSPGFDSGREWEELGCGARRGAIG